MLLDLNELSEIRRLHTDVCIVGAGAAGIALALELVDRDLDILLLESGALNEDATTQALYKGSVVNEHLHSPLIRYRQRQFGGTTTNWGGRCVPFDPIDFEVRDYVPHSGWPFRFEELASFYVRANEICEAGRFAYKYDEKVDDPHAAMIEGFAGHYFDSDRLERFSRPTNFGARYFRRLQSAKNLRILFHANVTHLDLEPSGKRVVSLRVQTLDGRFITVEAGRIVLAVGGLEVPRLLLASDNVMPGGLGNQHDQVGRYYMAHIAGTIGELRFHGPLNSVWNGYDVSDEGIYCRRRLALRAEVQREKRIGNFVARLHHPRITNPDHRNAILSALFLAKSLIPYEYSKRLHGDESVTTKIWIRHCYNVLSSPLDVIGFAWHMLRDRKLAERKFPSIVIKSKANLYSLDFHAEQEPNPESRVSLDATRDSLAMRRLRVDWRYTEGDVRSVSQALELLAEDIELSGIGRFDYDRESVEAEMTRYGAFGGHHIGTARMGTDPRCSVVDAQCRVHGIDNLYLASSAVFPTSSQANPTLTIVALAVRLAHHLLISR